MQQVEILQAKIDISELVAKYGHYCDHPGWDDVLALFTDDAVFDASTVYGKVMTGPAELRQFYETAPEAIAHHPTSQFTEVHYDGTASTHLKMIVLFHRQAFSVDYDWELVQRDGKWLIRRQTIGVIGKVRFAEGAAA
jgi:ketosteroid isomerase-like protein